MLAGFFLTPCIAALGQFTPGGYRMPATGTLSFTSAHRMIHGIHRDTAHFRAAAAPGASSRFTIGNRILLGITYLADRSGAGKKNPSHFTGREADMSILPLF